MDNFDDYMKDTQERATKDNFIRALDAWSVDELKDDIYLLSKENYELKSKLANIRRLTE